MTADPVAMAAAHVAWCIRQGMSTHDFYRAIRTELPRPEPTWADAIWSAAVIAGDERFHDDGEPISVLPPFRDPRPQRRQQRTAAIAPLPGDWAWHDKHAKRRARVRR